MTAYSSEDGVMHHQLACLGNHIWLETLDVGLFKSHDLKGLLRGGNN